MLSVASVIAIQKYNTADEALKMVGAFLGLFGVVIGSCGTYFFTRPPLKEAQRLAAVYQERAANAEQQLASLGKNTTSLLTELSKQGWQTPLATVKADPKVATSLKNIELNIESTQKLDNWRRATRGHRRLAGRAFRRRVDRSIVQGSSVVSTER